MANMEKKRRSKKQPSQSSQPGGDDQERTIGEDQLAGVTESGTQVSDRAQQLFKLMVERYLADGSPVASKHLASSPGVQVSSATVRNIMADLEALGLVHSPHTSAGKVPTVSGLRFFVDSLISVQPLDVSRIESIRDSLSPDMSPGQLVASASKLLSQATHLAGVVTMPRFEVVELRQVEFLPLSGDRVLVILVLNEREVQNRVIHTNRVYTTNELNQAARFINQHYAGKSLDDVRANLVASMESDKERLNGILQTAVDVASKALTPEANDGEQSADYMVAGESNLIDVQPDADAMQKMFEAFSEKGRILHLLDRCLKSDGIQLFIGEESGYKMLDDMSLVTAPYEVGGQVVGVLGIIGPTRMAYQEVIPVVDVTARLLGAAIDYDS